VDEISTLELAEVQGGTTLSSAGAAYSVLSPEGKAKFLEHEKTLSFQYILAKLFGRKPDLDP
jgi:hypothetical protein